MNLGLGPLLARLAAAPDEAYVLATVIDTQGSSYRKSGAMMLIAQEAEPVGLVSGGCLEGDLRAHAERVFADGRTHFVTYDLSRDDTALWGLGLGCGGAITVMLEAAAHANDFAGLNQVAGFWRGGQFCWLAKTIDPSGAPSTAFVATQATALPDAAAALEARTGAGARTARSGDGAWLLIPVVPPPRLVVCGAGPDAVPVADLARASGWRVSVLDHRPAFADPERFAAGVTAVCHSVADGTDCEALHAADAAIVMGHHLQRDADFVRALLAQPVRYIGLLGPASRRDEVLALAGVANDGRIYGPAGLDIGADLPETIALSILAEAQAVLRGAGRGSLSDGA